MRNAMSVAGCWKASGAGLASDSAPKRKPRLLDQLRSAFRARHYGHRTEQANCYWVKRFLAFHGLRHPREMAEPEINAFLTHLATQEKVSASTQNQALSALLFLYRHVIGREVGDLGEVIRARKPKRLPVVMIRDEVKALLGQLRGGKRLIPSLLYGTGLRLMECLRLRVQGIVFSRSEIPVRDGKDFKDRITMLPESLKESLQTHPTGKGSSRFTSAAWLGAAFRCRALWTASTPMRQPSGARNGCFLKRSAGRIRKASSKAVIISMPPRSQGRPQCPGQVGLDQARHLPYVSSFLCDSLVGRRLRYPDGAGIAGPRRRQDEDSLHPCPQPRACRCSESG